jgi:hypothetical protein
MLPAVPVHVLPGAVGGGFFTPPFRIGFTLLEKLQLLD